MEHYDEILLERRRELVRQEHTTIETGIYAGEELITFTRRSVLDSQISLPIPDQFIIMPQQVKDIKYPSKQAPEIILTSLDSMINVGFNLLSMTLQEGDLVDMSNQFQNALKNVNPTIIFKKQKNVKTTEGNEMSSFEYKGCHLDGQSYNYVYLIRMRKNVLHGFLTCPAKYKNNWNEIVDKMFLAVEEKW